MRIVYNLIEVTFHIVMLSLSTGLGYLVGLVAAVLVDARYGMLPLIGAGIGGTFILTQILRLYLSPRRRAAYSSFFGAFGD